MDITLVTTSFNDEVHGTENDKKTGCGINLMKPENVTRYHRSGTMTDLKDITCEKCKAVLAKKIIRSDKKEMDRLIKEEKLRAKRGIVDDGIVPLGNTTAKITKNPAEEAKKAVAEREAAEAKEAAEAARKAAEEEAKRAAEEEAARLAAEEAERQRLAARKNITGTSVPMDDSLAQFAIEVPKEEPEPAPAVQDDFLAQFAIKKPQEEEQPAVEAPADDFLAQFAVNNGVQNVQPVQSAAVVTEPSGADNIIDITNEDDIMKMFSLNGMQTGNGGGYGNAPVNTYENDHNVIDVEPSELSSASAPAEPEPEIDLSTVSEWDMVANQIFGYENAAQPAAPAVPEEMEELPVADAAYGTVTSSEEISAPVIEDIPVPENIKAPAIDDIAVPELNTEETNVYEGNGEDDMNKYRYSTPVFADEIKRSQPTVQPVQPKTPDQPQIITVPQFAGYDMNGQPIYTYVQMQMSGFDANGQPIFMPLPGQQPMVPPMNMPQQTPVQQAAPVRQAAPVQQTPVQQAAPVRQTAPVQQAPVQQAAPVRQTAPVQQAPVQQAAPTRQAAPVQQTPVQQAAPARQATPVQQAPVQQAAPARRTAPAQPGQYTTPTANISKIAVNPHSKSTSQAFINAIASSKDYADKNLIETQGLKANAPLLTSIEDVLSQMGDDSLKNKKAAAAKQNVPVYDEYKAGSGSASRSAAPRKKPQEEQDIRFMTKSELKAKKKQDKIDAKFKKDMAKRGL